MSSSRSVLNANGQRKLDVYWQALQSDPRLMSHAAAYAWAAGLFGAGWALDLGSEFGFGCALLADANPKLNVLGCDVDFRALDFARGNLEDTSVSLCQAAAHALPIASSSLSGLCLFNILHLVPEPLTIMRETRRVLKDGHRMVITLPRDDNLPANWRTGSLKGRLTDLAGRCFEEICFPDAVAAHSRSLVFGELRLEEDAPILVAVCR